MTKPHPWTGLALAALVAVPVGIGADGWQSALARGGGGPRGGGVAGGGGRGGGGVSGGGFSGGGFSGGSGASRGGAGRAQTGFQPAGTGLDRGSGRPTGGWSNQVANPQARPSLDRPAASPGGWSGTSQTPASRPAGGPRPGPGGGPGAGPANRPAPRPVGRTWTHPVNINSINVHPGWARPGWGLARPWTTGWYGGWSTPPWGWWGARAALWGIGSLASAAAINNAVNQAIDAQTTTIVVPQSDYQLLYGSVQPSGNGTIRFAVNANGSTYQLTADCNAGLLNGVDPASAAEAQLLNAACQVAFGNA